MSDDVRLLRRRVRPNTDLVRAVLDLLAEAGVGWAPRFVGVDAGDEVLSWIPGITADDWHSNPDRLDRLAEIVREMHDLTAELAGATDCIVHDDLQPRNVVIDNGVLGLIDWEQLRPGRRIEDVAQLCWSFAGPTSGDDVETVGRRWRRVLDAYKLEDRTEVVSVAQSKINRCINDIVGEASCGSERHQRLKERGDHEDLQAMLDWIDQNREPLTASIG